MPDKPETWAWLSDMLETYWFGIYAMLLAVFMSSLRVIYEGGKLRQILIEAPLLGLAALTLSHGVALMGISQDVAPFFGGMIGFIGVESTRELGMRFIKRGMNDNDDPKIR